MDGTKIPGKEILIFPLLTTPERFIYEVKDAKNEEETCRPPGKGQKS